jgi:uncharacterized protein (DUF305 family)
VNPAMDTIRSYRLPAWTLAGLMGIILVGSIAMPTIAQNIQGNGSPSPTPSGAGAGSGSTQSYGGMMGGGMMGGGMMGGGMMGGGMMGGGMMGDIDRHFIEQMIPHHQAAIEMAGLAAQKAQRPELKTLAAGIKQTQADEIQKMRTWYTDWYGLDVPTVSDARGQGMMGAAKGMGMGMGMNGDLTNLANAKDFDKAFITQMIPHHEMAVMMSAMVLVNGQHPELRDLARSIINGQSAEIDSMRTWYKAWYGTP